MYYNIWKKDISKWRLFKSAVSGSLKKLGFSHIITDKVPAKLKQSYLDVENNLRKEMQLGSIDLKELDKRENTTYSIVYKSGKVIGSVYSLNKSQSSEMNMLFVAQGYEEKKIDRLIMGSLVKHLLSVNPNLTIITGDPNSEEIKTLLKSFTKKRTLYIPENPEETSEAYQEAHEVGVMQKSSPDSVSR
jgi:hypothetical protein